VQRVAVRAVSPTGELLSAHWLQHGVRPQDMVAVRPGQTRVLREVGSQVVELERLGLRVHELALDFEVGDPDHPLGPELYHRPPPDDLIDHLDDRPDPPDRRTAVKVQRTGAYAVVVDGANVLLTRLARTAVWTLPGGGVDFGEHPQDAVRREVHEETGLTLTDVRLLEVDSDHWTGRAPYGRLEDFHAVRILYAASAPAGAQLTVVEVGGSTDAVAWMPIAGLDSLELGGTVRLAEPYLPGAPRLQRFT